LIVFQSSVFTQILIKGVELLSPGLVPQSGAWMALVVVLVVAVAGCWKSWRDVHPIGRPDVLALFAVYLSAYTVISLIVTGAFRGIILSNHVLYVVNIILVFLLLRNHVSAFWPQPTSGIKTAKWVQLSLAIVVIIVVLAFISVHLHDEMPGAHNRF
jgi:lysylphosphatidylglycerol synthetase-like protein (DUF2156 family)